MNRLAKVGAHFDPHSSTNPLSIVLRAKFKKKFHEGPNQAFPSKTTLVLRVDSFVKCFLKSSWSTIFTLQGNVCIKTDNINANRE